MRAMRDTRTRIDSFRLTKTEQMSISAGIFSDRLYVYVVLARVTEDETLLALGRSINIPADKIERLIEALYAARGALDDLRETHGGDGDV